MHKPRKALVTKKRPIQRGKEFYRWQTFREEVAIPYLDATFGHKCVECGTSDNLDVDHILGRGSHPSLKYDLLNLQYLCRTHHSLKTDGKI